MKVRVLAFATAADLLGDETTIELPDGSDVEAMRAALIARCPEIEPLWARLAVAVDGRIVRGAADLDDGAEVALLPPVSGGEPSARLTEVPLDIDAVRRRVVGTGRGATVLFIGSTRDHTDGQTVERLHYSAYGAMALPAIERIVRELEAAHEDLRLAIDHRVGDVPAGEPSVVIAAASAHRGAAFEAARKALERLKREVPIWKREALRGGTVRWREIEPLAGVVHET